MLLICCCSISIAQNISVQLCNNKNTKKPGVRFKVGRQVFIFPAFLCCSLIENRPAKSTANWTRCHGVTECVADCCGGMCDVLFFLFCFVVGLKEKKLHTFVRMVNAEKKPTIYWIKPPQYGNETCILCSSQCVNVPFVHAQKYGNARELVKYFMEMKSGDQSMHRIFSQMPGTWDSTSLAQLAHPPPILCLSQWNLPNHTAGGWKDSWVATFFYSKLFMQGLGLANLKKYIFLHRKPGTLCHVYSEKE